MHFGTNLILLTGATGWLGRSIVDAVVNGLPDCERLAEPDRTVRLRCLVLPGQERSELEALGNVEVIEGDIQEPEDCKRLCEEAKDATLIHTAGIIHPRRVSQFYKINLDGTKNLLQACVDCGVKRAVVVSSNSPCGSNPHPDHLFDETSPYNPYMQYGRSKMQMELAVKEFQNTQKLETVVIRAPWFYGPNQPPRQTLFFKMIRDGKMPLVGSGRNRRSMAYIENLVQGVLLAAVTESANGKIYWIADERPYAMTEIIDTVERLLESEFEQTCAHKRRKLPGFVSGIARFIDGSLQGMGMYHQKMHVLSEMNQTIACSIAEARKDLGYEPRIHLEEGMRRSIRWCFDQGLLP